MASAKIRNCVSLAVGILIGILLHYFLYRYSIPVKPFIYVSF